MDAETRYAIGMDIGSTNIRVALVSPDGQIIKRDTRKTMPGRGFDAVFTEVVQMLSNMTNAADTHNFVGIGIGAPGPLDPKEGVIIQTHNLGWKNVPLKKLVQERIPLPVYVDGDSNLAAFGEKWLGAARGVNDFVCLTLGTGVGGALILNGRIYHGATGAAGHIGHYIIDPDGPPCGCGGRGHLEVYASATAIVRRTIEAIKAGQKSLIPDLVEGDLSKLTSFLVCKAAKAGDELALRIFRETGAYIGLVITSLTHIVNPELVVIGGEVAEAGDLLFDSIREYMAKRVFLAPQPRIVPAMLGSDAGAIGAAGTVLVEEGIIQIT
jgi:glucokinase